MAQPTNALPKPIDPNEAVKNSQIDSSWIGSGIPMPDKPKPVETPNPTIPTSGVMPKPATTQAPTFWGALDQLKTWNIGWAIGTAVGAWVWAVWDVLKNVPSTTVGTGTTTPTQTTPDVTKPHSAGDVWDPAIGAWKIPTEVINEEDKQAQDVINNIFATNKLTTEQQDWWNKNVFNTPEERKKFLAMPDEERKAYMSNINKSNILTRDASLSAEYRKSQYDRQLADATAQVEIANEKAKADLEANANNFSVLQGTVGRLKSRNMANAISKQLDIGKKIYSEMIATNDRYLKAVADEYQYSNTVASNEYRDAMWRLKQDLLSKVESLQKTGAMNTASWLLQVKDFISSALAAWDVAMQQYSYDLQIGQERVKAMAEQMKVQNEFSKEMTEASKSPYLLNASGGIMTDAEGKPIEKDVTKKVEQVIQDGQGNATILYSDWSYSKPIAWIGKKDVEKPIFIDTENGKQQFVYDQATGTYVKSWEPIAKGASEWEYKTVDQIDPDTGEKISVPVWVNNRTQEVKQAMPWESAPGQTQAPQGAKATATGFDISGLADRAPNEASYKNNNPSGLTWNANFANALAGNPKEGTLAANLLKAGIQFKKGGNRPQDEGNNYVGFNSIQDGVRAMIIRWGMNTDLNLKQALKNWKWAGTDAQMNAYAQSIMNEAWLSDMKVWDITEDQFNKLLGVHIKHESGSLYGWMKENGYADDSGVSQSFFDTTTTTQAQWEMAQTTQTQYNANKIPQFQKYLDSWMLPTNIKEGSGNYNKFMQEYNAWKSQTKPLSETIQKRVDSYKDDYAKNLNVASAFKFAPVMRTYSWVDVSKLSSSQKQGIISDYAKALDPDSVVREGEYNTVAKYSQSLGEKVLSEIKQAFSSQGVISNEAAQKVIDAIMTRGKAYTEQEKNVRGQYKTQIDKVTGNNDGDSYLVVPDYSKGISDGTKEGEGKGSEGMIDTSDLDSLESEVQVTPSMSPEKKRAFMTTLDQYAKQFKDNPKTSKKIAEIKAMYKDYPLTPDDAKKALEEIQSFEQLKQSSIKPK